MLRNEASAFVNNPVVRILDWANDGTGGLLITTSTEHLAIRLGRALERAFSGDVQFGFSHENMATYISWHR
jgi:hypothetical protein